MDKNGVVTIVGAGTATLTVSLAESANYTADQKEVTIAVGKIEHSLVVDKISYKVTYGDPAFKITAKAGDKESGIQFASDNKEVATVSEDGTRERSEMQEQRRSQFPWMRARITSQFPER